MAHYIIRKIRLAHCKKGPRLCDKCREMNEGKISLLELHLPGEGNIQRRAITEALAKYVEDASGGLIIVTSDGKPIAALVLIENAHWETVKLSTAPRFLALIERSRARQKEEGGIASAQMRRRLGL